MNLIRWAAWGTINIETLDRQQRRNYLKKVRAELAEKGYSLQPGGSTQRPWYMVTKDGEEGQNNKQIAAGEGAFSKVCAWVLEHTGEAAHAPVGEVLGQ